MSTTASKGIIIPQNSDTGDVFFQAIAGDMQQLNDHTHDGANSQLLATTTQTISSANWIAAVIGGGLYYQTVIMPGPFNYDSCFMWFKLSSNQYVFPSIERVSSTSYNIYTNDNTLSYIANYR